MAIGRPREFDIGTALDKAQNVFCAKGYDAASIAELTTAMGINSPSLYAAFGSKGGLFRAVLDRYGEQRVQYLEEALSAPTARETICLVLKTAARLYSEDKDQASWLVMRGGVACGCDAIADDLSKRRERIELSLRDRFQKAADAGEFSGEALNPTALARYIMSVLTGMGIQAASGASREELEQIAAIATTGIPG
jgi:AcrR family transcriptional regulator